MGQDHEASGGRFREGAPQIAVVLKGYPRLSETFIAQELLALERRPLLSTGAFGLGLLAKPTAAVALPVAAVLTWLRAEERGRPRRRSADRRRAAA